MDSQHGTEKGLIRLAEVLAAFSLACDLGEGQPMGHSLRACYVGMMLAQELRLSSQEQAELYYASMLMHSGCTAASTAIAALTDSDELAVRHDMDLRDPANPRDSLAGMLRNVAVNKALPVKARSLVQAMARGVPYIRDFRLGTCEVAARMSQRLGLPPAVREALLNRLERWDGKGPRSLRGNLIPTLARIVHATMALDMFYAAKGRAAVERVALEQEGKDFDPDVIGAWNAIRRKPDFWQILEKEDLSEVILSLEPDSPYRHFGADQLDNVAFAFADFGDLKSATAAGHSRRTAKIAEAIARQMKLPLENVDTVRHAALVHDLGNVVVPSHILDKQGELTEAERERFRLHPYYTERILSKVPVLRAVAAIAGAHHEWLNGGGYYRGLSSNQIPLGARVLATADQYEERSHARPGHLQLEPEAVLQSMRSERESHLAADCFEALAQTLGVLVPRQTRRSEWAAGLTDREVEVLRFVAQGLSNRKIAQELVITEKTVEHHLTHVYDKIGISSRAAAVFFALENELLP